MDYKEYVERVSVLYSRYNNAKSHRCELTARARVRDIAKLYSQYKGIEYTEAIQLFREKLEANELIQI